MRANYANFQLSERKRTISISVNCCTIFVDCARVANTEKCELQFQFLAKIL